VGFLAEEKTPREQSERGRGVGVWKEEKRYRTVHFLGVPNHVMFRVRHARMDGYFLGVKDRDW
jgi:hypothetical protein